MAAASSTSIASRTPIAGMSRERALPPPLSRRNRSKRRRLSRSGAGRQEGHQRQVLELPGRRVRRLELRRQRGGARRYLGEVDGLDTVDLRLQQGQRLLVLLLDVLQLGLVRAVLRDEILNLGDPAE